MQSKERQKTKTLELAAIDGGNAHIKLQIGSELTVTPSYAAKLPSYQEVNPGSLYAEVGGERWVFGQVAKELRGRPVFELGKKEITPILCRAILNASGFEAFNRLRLLVPDARDPQWEEVEQAIRQVVPVTSVEFISEGLPPFQWASKNGLWSYPGYTNAVMDCGGGELSLVAITASGLINWDYSLKLPGTRELGQRIANLLAPKCQYTPSAGDVLSAIEQGTYTYADDGKEVEFYALFEQVRQEWLDEIRGTIRSRWMSRGFQLGEILMVGGGAALLRDLQDSTKSEAFPRGRFWIPENGQVPNFHQLINAYAMAL